jgi:hypothetical protein
MDEWPTDSRPTLSEIRVRYPNAYERWSPSDDARLMAGHREGRSIEELAGEFGRQPSAIEARLVKLALHALRAPADDDDYPWNAPVSDPEPPDLF